MNNLEQNIQSKSTMDIVSKTMPMILVRAGANIAKWLIVALVFGIIFGSGALLKKITKGSFNPMIINIVAVIAVIGVVYFINHWIMYLIKAGHVSVITYYMVNGSLPEEGQVEYAKNIVKKNFVATNVGFGFDSIVRGATNQALSVIGNVEDFLDFIPGIGAVMGLFKFFIKTVTNYVDEAVMAYIFLKGDEENVWKKTADGIVLYVQNWKTIFKASGKVAAIVLGSKAILLFLIVGFLTPLMSGKGVSFIVGVLIAVIVWNVLSSVLIEPITVIIMIKDYVYACSQSEVSYDLYSKMEGCSSKFKQIINKGL